MQQVTENVLERTVMSVATGRYGSASASNDDNIDEDYLAAARTIR